MNKKSPLYFLPYIVVFVLLVSLITSGGNTSSIKEFTYNEFKKSAEKMEFEDVNVGVRDVILSVSGTYVSEDKDGNDVSTNFSVLLPNTE